MPPLPEPFPGLVIRYSYLWRKDHLAGQEEGVKDRPCAIVLSTRRDGEDTLVTVAPITHSEPANAAMAVEIPMRLKQQLNLDSDRSWIVCTEVNRFIWPGPDLRRVPGSESSYSYGVLPPLLFKQVKQTLLQSLAKIVSRTV
jgi:mRNA-degrading endonuclease toxin of MazEF toxin-antitoxin module